LTLIVKSGFFKKSEVAKLLYSALQRRGAVDIASASGTEDPGSYPARLFLGQHRNAVLYVYGT
jgi:hypothetical protein